VTLPSRRPSRREEVRIWHNVSPDHRRNVLFIAMTAYIYTYIHTYIYIYIYIFFLSEEYPPYALFLAHSNAPLTSTSAFRYHSCISFLPRVASLAFFFHVTSKCSPPPPLPSPGKAYFVRITISSRLRVSRRPLAGRAADLSQRSPVFHRHERRHPSNVLTFRCGRF